MLSSYHESDQKGEGHEEAISDNKENVDPKKRRLSLSLKKRSRFVATTEDNLLAMTKPQLPNNTVSSSKWAMSNLQEWFKDYNSRNADNLCPEVFLTPSCSKEILNKWLCVFINETRSKNGDFYSPKSIYALLTGILRYMKVENPVYPNFLDKGDPAFSTFLVTLDNLLKSLRADGIDANSLHTEGISSDEENQLWTSGVLNMNTPIGLLRAVFFYNGKCFCLRGGQEHRDLGISQLQRLYNPDRYIYRENASKNRQGGIIQMRLEHKSVTIVANPLVGERCHVFLLDTYIGKLPQRAIENDVFYCKPLSDVPTNITNPWYLAVPVGKKVSG